MHQKWVNTDSAALCFGVGEMGGGDAPKVEKHQKNTDFTRTQAQLP